MQQEFHNAARFWGMDSPSLLVSVRSLKEAQQVWPRPVAILDFKEPADGSLGQASPELLGDFLRWKKQQHELDCNRPEPLLSFANGELAHQSLPLIDQISSDIASEFHFAKVGLADCQQRDWRSHWDRHFAGLSNLKPVMVSYVDHDSCRAPSPSECLQHAMAHPKCDTILLDTFGKSADLFGFISIEQIQKLVAIAHENAMRVVVAGSINSGNLSRVLVSKPDAIGVRGAVCRGDRASELCVTKLSRLLEQLAQASILSAPN
ncbi:MAG: (5-formylfuran-3-yl)methyl phosphate synthase [Planctomycetota bacterium]